MNNTSHAFGGDTSRRKWAIILPACFFMYMISFFDRVNIGMALPHITEEMSLSPVQGGMVGGAFAWGYLITQLLAGYLSLKFGPRRLIGIALVLFGAISMLTGLARTYEELLIIRFLLGVSEGPIYAATSMLLAQWFLKQERGRAFGIWNLSVAAGGFLAGPISAAILAHHSWRWMMVFEGLPAWIFCIIWFSAIPKSLESAKWMAEPDRDRMKKELALEQAAYTPQDRSSSWVTIFKERSVWFLMLGFACSQVVLYGITLWLPTIFKSYAGMSNMTIGLLSGAPFVMAMFGAYYITHRSDKHNQERRLHAAVPLLIMGGLLVVLALLPTSMLIAHIALILAVGFIVKMPTPLMSSYLTEILPLGKAVSAVGAVIGGGSFLGQLIGPLLVGYFKSVSPGYGPSFIALGVAAAVGSALLFLAKPGRKTPQPTVVAPAPAGDAAH